ncbi:hypothetical protein GQ53DRAFT_101380 [Thozetella sp. PMI_491]|nr:hypothetical protein GQ53DRAFT_101380 [Thozetella sp. PMI_491]
MDGPASPGRFRYQSTSSMVATRISLRLHWDSLDETRLLLGTASLAALPLLIGPVLNNLSALISNLGHIHILPSYSPPPPPSFSWRATSTQKSPT